MSGFAFPKSRFEPKARLIQPNGQDDPKEAAVGMVSKNADGEWVITEVLPGWSHKLKSGVTGNSLREIESYVRKQLGMDVK